MQTESESDDTLIRYLCGELAEAERDRLEELYFADDKLHERLAMLKDQMIDVSLTNIRESKIQIPVDVVACRFLTLGPNRFHLGRSTTP